MNIQEKIQQLDKEFDQFDDWLDKYNYLIELGKNIPLIDEKYRNDSYLIKGCQSRVWLQPDYRDGKIFFAADSDAVITRGIASLLIRVFSGESPEVILSTPADFIDSLGLREHLSPTRSNGLTAMIKQMKLYALAYSTRKPTSL